jgi:hypothetical protein
MAVKFGQLHSDKNRLRTAEMNYLRRTARYTLLNHKRNEEILEELHVTPLEDKLCNTDISGYNMFIEWKTTGSQNNFWIIIQKEDDNLEDHVRDY